VSSVFAAAAAIKRELTLPGVTQTVILTRAEGRTPVPQAESLSRLAGHGATLAVFLSGSLIGKIAAELLPSYGPDAPVRVVYRASWPDERIVSGTLSDIADSLRAAGIEGPSHDTRGGALSPAGYERSRLYESRVLPRQKERPMKLAAITLDEGGGRIAARLRDCLGGCDE
jgi:precorrin-4/cobalt-precorrin-4 C11-methyltransferase